MRRPQEERKHGAQRALLCSGGRLGALSGPATVLCGENTRSPASEGEGWGEWHPQERAPEDGAAHVRRACRLIAIRIQVKSAGALRAGAHRVTPQISSLHPPDGTPSRPHPSSIHPRWEGRWTGPLPKGDASWGREAGRGERQGHPSRTGVAVVLCRACPGGGRRAAAEP